MKPLIVALPLLLLPAAQEDPGPTVPDAERVLFHAVLEGLYTDGLRNDVVDAVMARDEKTTYPRYFIYACPICMPAWNAFAVYRARPKFLGNKLERDSFGDGLDEETRAVLMKGSTVERMEALRALVKRWVGRRIDLMRLTGAERAAFEQRFEDMREKGLAYLESYRKNGDTEHLYRDVEFCPFCDGACEPDRGAPGGR